VIEIYDFFRIIKFSNPLYSILTNFYNEIINKNKIKLNNIEKILILFERENILEENLRYIKEIFHEDKKIEKKQLNRFYSLDININHNKTFSILNYEKNEILNHLTFLSKNYFYEIDKKELLNSKFSKKNKEKDSPNIIKLINNSNNLANIIKVNILSEKNIQNIAKIIEKWIIISDLCKKINNFNDCFTINLALNSYMISSLLKTWKKVDETYISLFNEIKEFCSPISNFKYLREAIKNCINCPYLPFLGVYLKDFTNYNELYKYIKNDKLINFMKINLIERSIQDFFKYKNIKYNINPVYKLDFFENIKSISEEELDYLYNKIKDK
jgi:son of sevenless-like protein